MLVHVDDRATTLLALVAENTFAEFSARWRPLARSQGFPLSSMSPFSTEERFNELKKRNLPPISAEAVEAIAHASAKALAELGFHLPKIAHIRLCVGGLFNARAAQRIYISVDRTDRLQLNELVTHELAHIATPGFLLGLFPLDCDRRLFMESLAIWAARLVCRIPLEAASGFTSGAYRRLTEQLYSLKNEMRSARLGTVQEPKRFPADPFTASTSSPGQFERYGYVLAAEMLKDSGSDALKTLIDSPRRASALIRDFLALTPDDEARIICDSPEKVNSVDNYVALSQFRRSSWEGAFPFLSRYDEARARFQFKTSSILDIGCGTGHVLENLCRDPIRVAGIDKSPAMIEIARHRTIKCKWICADILNYKGSEQFSLVLSTFDTLNYLAHAAGIEKSLECISRYVGADGTLLFDFITHKGFASRSGTRSWQSDVGRSVELLSWDSSAETLTTTIYCQPKGEETIFKETHLQLAISKESVCRVLSGLGYSEIHAFDFATGADAQLADPKRVLVIARV